eukprot:gene10571-14199_t
MDNSGYVPLNQLLELKEFKNQNVTLGDIQLVVETNEKQRFNLIEIDGEWFIRANQGHSAEVGELIYDELAMLLVTEPFPHLYHGTETRFISSILESGLMRMKRKHIHCVQHIKEEEQTSGFKSKSQTIIEIDMMKCMNDGMIFYLSSNQVVLTEGFDGIIPPEYIVNVLDRLK